MRLSTAISLGLLITCSSYLAAEEISGYTSKTDLKIRFQPPAGLQLLQLRSADLHYSSDDGATWTTVPSEQVTWSDGQFPLFAVSVPSEGKYWFKTSYKTITGIDIPAPQAGATPDYIFVVDTTNPEISEFSVQLNKGSDQPELRVIWDTSDGALGDQPVRLEASADGKSWVTWLPDMPAYGLHKVAVEDSEQPWLRLVVTDQAGNSTTSAPLKPGTQATPTPAAATTPIAAQTAAPKKSPAESQASTTTQSKTTEPQTPDADAKTTATSTDENLDTLAGDLITVEESAADVDASLAQQTPNAADAQPSTDSETAAAAAATPAPSIPPHEIILSSALSDWLTIPQASAAVEQSVIDSELNARRGRLLLGKLADDTLNLARDLAQAEHFGEAENYYRRLAGGSRRRRPQ